MDRPIGLSLLLGLHRNSLFRIERDYNPWAYANEKSAAAIRREDEARSKFVYLNSQMDLALYENTMTTIGLACHAKSKKSPLRLLSSDVMEQVLAFAGCTKPKRSGVKAVAAGRDSGSLAIVPFAGWRQKKNAPDETQLNLADVSLFRPGFKIVVPLTKPNLHLTQPCYRDLRKYIKTHANWDVQRTAASDEEKRQYKETRKGAVYFINAVYTVSKKANTGKRKRAVDMMGSEKISLTPLSPGTQEKATSALQAAVRSAASDLAGKVDPEMFQRALDVGYSKHFIREKVDEHLKSINDTKPPAKKTNADEEE